MTLSILLGTSASAFTASWLCTQWYRTYALKRNLLDVPNTRSSHAVPTPRGGGIAIILVSLSSIAFHASIGIVHRDVAAGLIGGGLLSGAIGYLDDTQRTLSTWWRLAIHLVAAAWILFWLPGFPPIPVLGTAIDLGWVGFVGGALYLVWMLNLTNFMDGIDGITSVEAFTVCLAGALLSMSAGGPFQNVVTPLACASATAGFLVWNWPPAKIFLGDAGSGFLGLLMAALSLQAASFEPRLLWSWLIMLGIFVVDASVTLAFRIALGNSWREAHRTHAYQHLATRSGSHLSVTLGVALINTCLLFPVALMVALGMMDGALGVLVTYALLAAMAIHQKAGRP